MNSVRLRQGPSPVDVAAAPPSRVRKPLLTRSEGAGEAVLAATVPVAARPAPRALSSRLTEIVVLAIAVVLVIYGYAIRQSDTFVPYEGLGYYLGIAGGTGMLLQLGYAYAKKLRAFHTVTASRALFHVHMILGLGAPIAILYHCKFSWGAKNSNVALIAMLLVVASGIAGRIVHRKVQVGLRQRERGADIGQWSSDRLRDMLATDTVNVARLIAQGMSALAAATGARDKSLAQQLWIAISAPFRIGLARLEFARLIRGAVTQNATLHGWSADDQNRFRELANCEVVAFLRAHYTVPQLLVWERLLSLWHLLHVPLFYVLVLAGIVHVVSVHWY